MSSSREDLGKQVNTPVYLGVYLSYRALGALSLCHVGANSTVAWLACSTVMIACVRVSSIRSKSVKKVLLGETCHDIDSKKYFSGTTVMLF